MSEQRTEKATPRRRQKALEDGDRVHSRDLLTASGMLAGALALEQVAPRLAVSWPGLYASFLAMGNPVAWDENRVAGTLLVLRGLVLTGLKPLLVILIAVFAAVAITGVAQNGGLALRAKPLEPKFARLNPIENAKNLFSTRSAARLLKTLAPAALLLFLAVRQVEQEMALPSIGVARLTGVFESALDLLLDTAWIFFAWSVIDYLVEWRSRESRLKMSREEMREEFKQTEGNPQVRRRIRSLQRQMRRRQQKADVSRASVIVTNPTHYAVALSFDFETMEAPKVLAKGRDLLAQQIREDARWAGVPIVENPPLARSLYRHVEPGQSIPFDLYAAVAAILAYLYRQQVEERVRREHLRRQRSDAAAPKAHTNAGTAESPVTHAQADLPTKEKS